jgi:hypothetical protein
MLIVTKGSMGVSGLGPTLWWGEGEEADGDGDEEADAAMEDA